jgi:hypothetical protein
MPCAEFDQSCIDLHFDIGYSLFDILRFKNINYMDVTQLTYIPPDPHFFIDTRKTAEACMGFIFKVLAELGSDSEDVSAFMSRLRESPDVIHALFYGSAVNHGPLKASEVEDVDLLVVTRTERRQYPWGQLRGVDMRCLSREELTNLLRVKKFHAFSHCDQEYFSMAGMMANGIIIIKSSAGFEDMIKRIRKDLKKRKIECLSQVVEFDCMKRARNQRQPDKLPGNRMFSFYGSGVVFSEEETCSMIKEGIRRKNIQITLQEFIIQHILKRARITNLYEARGPVLDF